ncbi:hypothetical protein DRH14_03810 [Candidatus Shapirobacteria bacterium]|nr:MAG: hypothetical protein DRH14_03810 [Candidatus Shapirobacteria bacterium]
MPNNEAFEGLLDREIETMRILLLAKSSRTAITLEEYVKVRTLQGTGLDVIKQDLLTDLREGGRIFGEFRNSVKATAAGSINRLRDDAEFSEIGVDLKYRWSAVLVNTCSDCLERHGTVAEWDEWEVIGLPRSGSTVCRENCKCVLLPEESTELAPIRRVKK